MLSCGYCVRVAHSPTRLRRSAHAYADAATAHRLSAQPPAPLVVSNTVGTPPRFSRSDSVERPANTTREYSEGGLLPPPLLPTLVFSLQSFLQQLQQIFQQYQAYSCACSAMMFEYLNDVQILLLQTHYCPKSTQR